MSSSTYYLTGIYADGRQELHIVKWQDSQVWSNVDKLIQINGYVRVRLLDEDEYRESKKTLLRMGLISSQQADTDTETVVRAINSLFDS